MVFWAGDPPDFAYSESMTDDVVFGRQVYHVNHRNDYEAHLNRSLDDAIELLEREIARLKESLATYRLSSHPRRGELVRWHVRTLDQRQDTLDELRAMLLAVTQPEHPPVH